MGGATTDIVARLQLRAEQFSSETGARFAELKTRARSAAQEVRDDFVGAFAEVQRISATSLRLPRTDTGSLDLSAEIAQLNASATASEIKAQANRELAIAWEVAAASANESRQALLLEADALAVGALAEERNAQATRERIAALELVQVELNKTTSQTRKLTVAEEEAAAKATRGGNFTMLGQQFQDFTVQVMSGQSAITAFVQQLPQATFALSTMGGAAGKVGAFMTGPWGTALTIGTLVLVPLIAKTLDFGNAAEEAGDKAKHAAEGADAWADAASGLGKVIDLTNGKLKTHNIVVAEAIRLEAIFKKQQGEKEAEAAQGVLERAANRRTPVAVSYTPGGFNQSYQQVGGLSAPGLFDLTKRFSDGKVDIREARIELEKLGAAGKLGGREVADVTQQFLDLAKARDKIAASDAEVDAIDGKPLDSRFKPYKRDPKPKKGRDLSGMSNSAEEEIARINAAWDDQPRLIDKAMLETQKLDNLIGDLSKKKPPNWEKLVQDAQAAKVQIERGLITAIGKAFEEPETLYQKGGKALGELDTIIADLQERKPPNWESLVEQARAAGDAIRNGMDRPFTDFVQQQRESLAVGQLVLAGRDAEADAMRSALQLQERMGRALRDDELKTVLELAEQHERIARAIEDQRRVIGIYTGAVNDFQSTFDQFLETMQRGDLAGGVKGLFGGVVESWRKAQRALISNALFGGVDREVENYIRKMTGEKTPQDVLREQAGDAGAELRRGVADSKSAFDEFSSALRALSREIAGVNLAANDNAPTIRASLSSIGSDVAQQVSPVTGADYSNDIVVTGIRKAGEDFGASVLHSANVWEVATRSVLNNFERVTGIMIPESIKKALERDLPTVIQGAANGQLGGSVFSAITGGKDNKMASSLGGILGGIAGKEIGKLVPQAATGLLKSLGGAAGPIGSIVGGVLGNVVASLFAKPTWSNASLTMANGQVTGTTGTGRGSAEISAATNTASSVAEAVNSIVNQIGASVQSLVPITMGTFNGRYRVDTQGRTGSMDSKHMPGVADFGDDQQAAIQYAVAYEISHAVITGISEASKRILASGQNMETALNKVLMIEAIPKDLKAMLDPVGAAIDDLNRKWKQTVDALKEGGASAEQMAQAERLYNLQLEQVKATTASASETLKKFRDSLKLGPDSAYSLRDQEATAKAALQPFLDQINAGQSVDQEKYQAAAEAFLSIERQIYGSTQDYFSALDAVQAATNKAISAIDNVAPISPDVESPFAKATADSAAATAANTQTGNEMTQDTNALLQRIADRLDALGLASNDDSDFIGSGRLFKSTGAI